LSISVVFAIIDGIVKLNYQTLLSILLCVYVIVTIIAIVIGIAAKHELYNESLDVVHTFNNTQIATIEVGGYAGHGGVPKYLMTVHAEKVQSRKIHEEN
jgi:hypothetical protein